MLWAIIRHWKGIALVVVVLVGLGTLGRLTQPDTLKLRRASSRVCLAHGCDYRWPAIRGHAQRRTSSSYPVDGWDRANEAGHGFRWWRP